MPKAKNNFPVLIRELRKHFALTQEQFAARLGVTFPTVNRWENGRAKPSPLALQKVEELLNNIDKKGRELRKRFIKEWESNQW